MLGGDCRVAWRRLLPSQECLQLLQRSKDLLLENFWGILVIFTCKDALAFLLHRVSQRATNWGAEAWLGLPIPTFANPWWLVLDPQFLDAQRGYQVLMGLFFLLALPLNIYINAAAWSAAALLATRNDLRSEGGGGSSSGDGSSSQPGGVATVGGSSSGGGSSGGGGGGNPLGARSAGDATRSHNPLRLLRRPPPKPLPAAVVFSGGGKGRCGVAGFRGAPPGRGAAQAPRTRGLWQALRQGVDDAQSVLPSLRPMMLRLWHVDLLFNLRALPLQALALLVVPLFWTLPRLLGIQLALPAAALGGAAGRDALERSRALLAGRLAWYAWPFVGLLAASRGLESARQAVLVAIPVRWWQEVVELPILATLAFAVAKVVIGRMQDLLPLAAYLQLAAGSGPAPERAADGGAGGAAVGGSGGGGAAANA